MDAAEGQFQPHLTRGINEQKTLDYLRDFYTASLFFE